MTHTITAPRSARRWLTMIVATLVAVIVLAIAPPAQANAQVTAPAAVSPSPTPTPTPASTVEIVLAPLGNGVVSLGGTLATSLDVRNNTSNDLAAGTATLSVGAAPLADRQALAAWDDQSSSLQAVAASTTVGVDAVAAGSVLAIAANIDSTDLGFSSLAPGVYPLLLEYRSGGLVMTATSVMVIVDPLIPAQIAVVVPITAAPSDQGLLTAAQLTELTARDGALSAVLDGVDGTTAILAIDPAVVAAIRVLGTSAPPTATEWLERLDALPNTRFALQFGDADISAQVHAGITTPLQPTSLVTYLDQANFPVPTQTGASPNATPTPTPTSIVVPDLAELTTIAGAIADVYWPAAGTADAQVLQAVNGFVEGATPLTLVASHTTSAGSTGAAVPAVATVGESKVLVYDTETSAATKAASDTEDTVQRRAALATASAYLAFARADTGGAPLLVTLEHSAPNDRLALHAAILAVTGAPGVSPLTLTALAAQDPVATDVANATPDTSRTAVVGPFLADEARIAEFATILDTPALLTGPERAQILHLLGAGWNTSSDTWTDAVAAHTERSAKTLTSVEILPTSEINLASSSAALRFWIRNDLPWPVNVVLTTRSSGLRLYVQSVVPVTANPSSNTRAEVPVQARVGRGDVTLELQLRSRTSVAIGSPQTADVRVRAEWETIGLTALAIVVGGLLVAGLTRTVLRRRKDSKASTDESAEDNS